MEPMPLLWKLSLNHWTVREVPPLQPFLIAHCNGIQRLNSVVQEAPCPSLELFHFTKLKLGARYTVTPHAPPPSPLEVPLLLSVSLHLATLCASYKCDHTVLVHW